MFYKPSSLVLSFPSVVLVAMCAVACDPPDGPFTDGVGTTDIAYTGDLSDTDDGADTDDTPRSGAPPDDIVCGPGGIKRNFVLSDGTHGTGSPPKPCPPKPPKL